ncbi:hypothetical protein ACJBWM_11595, partial [Streptococcus suis]
MKIEQPIKPTNQEQEEPKEEERKADAQNHERRADKLLKQEKKTKARQKSLTYPLSFHQQKPPELHKEN